MTLAEILEEGKRLEAAVAAAVKVTDQVMLGADLSRWYALHGPRLLAVAEAAVEMRSFIAYDTSDMDPGDTLGWNEMIRAFDAAAAPEAKCEREEGEK